MRASRHLCYVIALLVLHVGCTPQAVFPPEVQENLDRTISVDALKRDPNAYRGVKIELGGQIGGSTVSQNEVRILARHLPIRTHPVYGPVDIGRLQGMFVIRYPGMLTNQDLQHGNMIVVVGTVLGAVSDPISGASVIRPTVQAQCLHIWRTGGAAIEDFPWPPFLQGYSPLVEAIYCVDSDNTFLTTS